MATNKMGDVTTADHVDSALEREAIVSRVDEQVVEELEWGALVWMVSGSLGNSDSLTFGRCVIEPGMENPRHHHPNCDEVLHLVQGTIEHLCGNESVILNPGDAITIPAGMVHNARNIGSDTAVMLIAFSSADRRTVTEGSS